MLNYVCIKYAWGQYILQCITRVYLVLLTNQLD